MLNKRLKAIESLIPNGMTFADIGTDHANLPISAIKSGKSPFAIACDVNLGPYNAAKKNVSKANLDSKISVRLGSGLEKINPNEVELSIFAGMGGILINQLIKDNLPIFNTLKGVILQPQTAVKEVRENLYSLNWHIKDELLVKDNSHLYQIIYAIPDKKETPDNFSLKIGPCLLKKKPKFWLEYLDSLIKKTEKIILGIKNSQSINYKQLTDEEKFLNQLKILFNEGKND